MKKLYEAVPVEKEKPEISTVNICILENGSSVQMHYGYGGWSEAGHYDKTWMGSPVKFWLREVGSSVSTEDIIEMIDERIKYLDTIVERGIDQRWYLGGKDELIQLRARITGKTETK